MLRWRTRARRATSPEAFENGYASLDWQIPAIAHTAFGVAPHPLVVVV